MSDHQHPEADYRYILDAGTPVARTAEINPGLLVDLDEHNRIIGVERIGDRVDADAIAEVLTHCTWKEQR